MTEIFWIQEYDEELLQTERLRIFDFFSRILPGRIVHEVGSTAIEGVVGKGDLDFLLLVSEMDFKSVCEIIDKHLHRNKKQLSANDFQGYLLESKIDCALQVTIEGGQYDDFLDFIDRMNEIGRAHV